MFFVFGRKILKYWPKKFNGLKFQMKSVLISSETLLLFFLFSEIGSEKDKFPK